MCERESASESACVCVCVCVYVCVCGFLLFVITSALSRCVFVVSYV